MRTCMWMWLYCVYCVLMQLPHEGWTHRHLTLLEFLTAAWKYCHDSHHQRNKKRKLKPTLWSDSTAGHSPHQTPAHTRARDNVATFPQAYRQADLKVCALRLSGQTHSYPTTRLSTLWAEGRSPGSGSSSALLVNERVWSQTITCSVFKKRTER